MKSEKFPQFASNNAQVMKLLIFSFISLVAASSIARDPKLPNPNEIFANFTTRMNIKFQNDVEYAARKKIFDEKLREIDDHNKKFERGEKTFKMDINEFSLFTHDEMKKMTMGDIEEPNEEGPMASEHLNRKKRDTSELPVSWSWKNQGVLRAVRHQGNCGSCYAFAAIGAIESRMQIVHGISTDLSEQEAIECTNGCNGGYDFQIYDYATNRDGCTPNSALPYQPASLHACSTSSTRIPESKVESYFNVPKNESEIRFYLYNKGPLSVVMNVYENFYSYSSGVYSTISGNYIGVHAALLVGYGSENGVDYWMVKNSWGTSWGLSGYFKIKRGSNLCRIEDYRISFGSLTIKSQ